jgi:uncharacterized protein
MPSALTFPGVYVEELPSGVRTITGVATSIAAFVGRAARGPTNTPVVITSFADFTRTFGNLDRKYQMGYAVRDFYQNGGSTAVIVRGYGGDVTKASKFAVKSLLLRASSPGTWGDKIRVRVEQDHVPAPDLGTTFNLTIHDTGTGATESYAGVTTADTSRRVDRVLAANGSMLTFDPALPADLPVIPSAFNTSPVVAGDDVWDPAKTYSSGVSTPAAADDGDIWATDAGNPATKTGIYALQDADLFNLLLLIADKREDTVPAGVLASALAYVVKRRALLIVDPPSKWTSVSNVNVADLSLSGDGTRNAAVYFPRVLAADPMLGGQLDTFSASGMVAGVMARTDVGRGVWKAPAGVDAGLLGAQGLSTQNAFPFQMTDDENGLLNPVAVNCLRTFPIYGAIVWGARTLRGADILGDDYKYVPVRRVALFIEESLFRGLKWVVFEPNDEPLWAQIRLNVGAFMQNLFRQGAFQGASARDAYFVNCDKSTTTQNDINLGIVNVIVGFAPLKPAEFVVLKIQQIAGQIQT